MEEKIFIKSRHTKKLVPIIKWLICISLLLTVLFTFAHPLINASIKGHKQYNTYIAACERYYKDKRGEGSYFRSQYPTFEDFQENCKFDFNTGYTFAHYPLDDYGYDEYMYSNRVCKSYDLFRKIEIYHYEDSLKNVRSYGGTKLAAIGTGVSWLFALSALILGVCYAILRKCSLEITDKNVKGKTLFGREVILPLYQISAFSTRKLFSTIVITSSSGKTKFSLIENHQEIIDTLQRLVNERQANTEINATDTNASLNELKQLKALLDEGVITQEEFDEKKKQILGL